MIDISRLPTEVLNSQRAVVWRAERRGEKSTKVPYCPRQPTVRAAVDNSATWSPFAVALATVRAGRADGAGIVLGLGLVGVDLDHCRNPKTGVLEASAQEIVATLESYTEVSPSGTGVHILMRGTLPRGRRRVGPIEMYDSARYFTVTGEHIAGTPKTIEQRTLTLAILHERLFGQVKSKPAVTAVVSVVDDASVLARAHAARNGSKFAALWRGDWSGYPSQSEADQALCNHLAFWTGGDARAIDRLFRQSGLYRSKWDERRRDSTYGWQTISTALAGHLSRGRAR